MEKKYIEAVAFVPGMGDVKVVFDDVRNFTERTSGDTQIMEFDDADSHYTFTKVGQVWSEVDEKAPSLKSYNMVCRRTARKHGSVGDGVQRTAANSDNWKNVVRDEEFGQAVSRALHDIGFGVRDEDEEDE